MSSLYDIRTTRLSGEPVDLSIYRGKVSLVVNVASRCGFTPQYQTLEELHRSLGDAGFTVLGFPSNDFGGQEPGTPEQIASFCKTAYDVTFPVFEKVRTRNGPGQSPVYGFLATSGNLPAWNFAKYVVGRDGQVVAFFPSPIAPQSPEVRAAILRALSSASAASPSESS